MYKRMIIHFHLLLGLKMHVPVFGELSIARFSVALAKPLFLAPMNLQKRILENVLTILLKEAQADGATDFFEGRWCQVVIEDLNMSWFITVDNNGPVVSKHGIQPAVTISGNTTEFILIASRREDPDTLFFQRRLVIEGDTEFGLNVKNLIDSVDFDCLPRPLVASLELAAGILTPSDVD